MKRLLTDAMIRKLATPETGMLIVRDSKIKGLGVRILPSGTSAFILDYVVAGRRRIHTIGRTSEWKITEAREHARNLKHDIRYAGYDPAAKLKAEREAPTVEDICELFRTEHLPKLRPATRVGYEAMFTNELLPTLGRRKVASIEYADLQRLHRMITERGAPVAANLCIALCSKLFTFAIKHKKITTNPAKGIVRNPVQPRNRYLDKKEIGALMNALAAYSDQDMADVFRLLLFTGARRGETQSATWAQFDLDSGLWVKPAHATKQDREHRVPLSMQARTLLAKRRALADTELAVLKRGIASEKPSERAGLLERRRRVDTYIFPARDGATGHISELKKAWASVCRAAGISQTRIHDLRHTAASVLASSGANLPLIGQLLGHTQAATTQRYAHLFTDAQREAVDKLGAFVSAQPEAKILPFGKR